MIMFLLAVLCFSLEIGTSECVELRCTILYRKELFMVRRLFLYHDTVLIIQETTSPSTSTVLLSVCKCIERI
jgi:hypothetical protein